MGIVSGELVGKVEDSETHGCADFFRVPEATTISDYMQYAKETVTQGNIHRQRGERLLTRGITFIVDPHAEGMAELMAHDGYTDPDMESFINPPDGRSAEDTAAILGGVPRGAIAGILASEKLLNREGVSEQLATLFPGLPVMTHEGKLHT